MRCRLCLLHASPRRLFAIPLDQRRIQVMLCLLPTPCPRRRQQHDDDSLHVRRGVIILVASVAAHALQCCRVLAVLGGAGRCSTGSLPGGSLDHGGNIQHIRRGNALVPPLRPSAPARKAPATASRAPPAWTFPAMEHHNESAPTSSRLQMPVLDPWVTPGSHSRRPTPQHRTMLSISTSHGV
jgi:hypothetical protein